MATGEPWSENLRAFSDVLRGGVRPKPGTKSTNYRRKESLIMMGYYPVPRPIESPRTYTCKDCGRSDKSNTPEGRQWFEVTESGKRQCPGCQSGNTEVTVAGY